MEPDVSTLLVLIRKRRSTWTLDNSVQLAVQAYTDFFEKRDETTDYIGNIKTNWQALLKSNQWELVSLGIHGINAVLRSHAVDDDSWLQSLVVYATILIFHTEPRIRNQVIDLLENFSLHQQLDIRAIYLQMEPLLTIHIQDSWERKQETFAPVLVPSKSPEDIESLNLGLDDTTGWNDLESTLLCLQRLIIVLAKRCEHDIVSGEVFDLVISKSSHHINRHIRQCCLMFCKDFITILGANSERDVFLLEKLNDPIARSIMSGLDENWGQLRRLACNCAELYFSNFPSRFTQAMMHELLPRLCMNRFYSSAAGVESAALSAWKHAVGSKGRELLCSYIHVAVPYYVGCTRASNHEISEAAIMAISELVEKLPREVVESFVEAIAESLVACISDPSWPVRDAACKGSGILLSHFSSCCPVKISLTYMDAWIKHLTDAIQSIRENAVAAINSVLCGSDSSIIGLLCKKIDVYLDDSLKSVIIVNSGFLPETLLRKSIDKERTRASGRRGPSWGCCIDCIAQREAPTKEKVMTALFVLRLYASSLWHTSRLEIHINRCWRLALESCDGKDMEISVEILSQFIEMVETKGIESRVLIQYDNNYSQLLRLCASRDIRVSGLANSLLKRACITYDDEPPQTMIDTV